MTMTNRKWTLIEAITCAVAILLLLALADSARAAGDMPPQKAQPPVVIGPPPEQVHVDIRCPYGMCFVPQPIFDAIHETNLDLVKENAVLRELLEEAKKGKRCAILEVAPPQRGGKS